MCGIIGYTGKSRTEKAFSISAHRGPDNTSSGVFGRFTLGHNRLAIIDLNESANQPFVSEDGKYVMVFNGEIYNFQAIRKELEKDFTFRTNSDTEVILYNYIKKGKDCLKDLIGMFAFAIYDIENDYLFCSRDRLGIKPFIYTNLNNQFAFASEIKNILEILPNKPEVNYEAIEQYLHYLYVPFPNTIYEGIHKLPPGHVLINDKGNISIEKYWDINDYIHTNMNLQEKEILENLDTLLNDAVSLRMIADVKLGSFLSGGIDSTSILYYMNKNSSIPVNTYTLGFEGAKKYDERSDAKIVSDYFKTNHTEILIDPKIVDLLDKMVFHFDEPFGNPTSLLIHELTKETKKHVTVALAGDGGDEIFGGYPRYEAALLFKKVRFIPKPIFQASSFFLNFIPESSEGNHKLRRIKTFVKSLSNPQDEMYENWVSYFSDKELKKLLKEFRPYTKVVKNTFNESKTNDLLLKASLTDLKTFLPNNLLTYGDAMSMANAFEVRFPLIDHRIIEFITSVSTEYRIKNGQTKYLMKKILKDKIPDQILNKPKLGLNPPMGIWLKKDLKNLVHEYLSKESINKRGLFNYEYIKQLIDENESNKKDRSLFIWSLIVLEKWFRNNID
jgi:asparagine synthase (glutamine-hydrolysing)